MSTQRNDKGNKGKKANKSGGRCRLRGSFTLETALLMSVILPVLTALILAGFYAHDEAVLEGMVCEAGAAAADLVLYDESQAGASRVLEAEKGQLIWASPTLSGASAGRDGADIQAGAAFPVPGFVRYLMGPEAGTIQTAWHKTIVHPAELIRQVRGLKHVAEIIMD